MQLHRRRFEYLDNKIKTLQTDAIDMQDGIARIKKAIENQKNLQKNKNNRRIRISLTRQ